MIGKAKVCILANAKIEDFNFKNKTLKESSFQIFVDFSPDLERPTNKHFRTDFRYTYILI